MVSSEYLIGLHHRYDFFRIKADSVATINTLIYHSSCVGLMLWSQINKPVIYLVKP